MAEQVANVRKAEKLGQVVSAKMAKTIVVQVTRKVPHPLYKRIITKHKKFYAHDDQNSARVGDTVRIVECRPMSRLKRWKLQEIVRRAVQVEDVTSVQDTGNKKTVKRQPKAAS
jgi:small subunit ribosomal protein S17